MLAQSVFDYHPIDEFKLINNSKLVQILKYMNVGVRNGIM